MDNEFYLLMYSMPTLPQKGLRQGHARKRVRVALVFGKSSSVNVASSIESASTLPGKGDFLSLISPLRRVPSSSSAMSTAKNVTWSEGEAASFGK